MSTAALWRYGTRFTERYNETLQRVFFGVIFNHSLKHHTLQLTRSVVRARDFIRITELSFDNADRLVQTRN